MSSTVTPDTRHFWAALAGWVFPGLGHWLLGERKRACILAVAIGLLWFAGLLIGGISAIDVKRNMYWFLSQMLMSPSVVVDRTRDWVVPELTSPTDERLGYSPALGRASEQGVLFTALAGLLNLLAIIDVMHRPTRPDAPAPQLFGASP